MDNTATAKPKARRVRRISKEKMENVQYTRIDDKKVQERESQRIKDLEAAIKDMEVSNQAKDDEIRELYEEMADYKGMVHNLEHVVKKFREDILDLRKSMEDLENSNQSQDDEIQELCEEISDIRETMENLEGLIQISEFFNKKNDENKEMSNRLIAIN